MTAFQKKILRFVKMSPLGLPLRTAWRRLRRFANRKPALSLTRKPIDERKTEITKHATYRLQDFLISGQTLPFPQADQPIISVVLVLFNRAELTFRCLRSLKENTHLPIEIIVIDNGSTDLTERLLQQVTGVRYVRNTENKHFLRGTNQGAELARGTYLLLLNSDTELTPGSIEVALNALESDPSLGAVGGRLILPDGTLQEAGCFVWDDGTCQGYGRGDDPTAGPYMFPRLVDFCSGAFLLTPRSLWDELGGFDEAFVPAYYEEADYCMRLWKAGRPVRYEPIAAVWHFEFASSQSSAAPVELMLEHQKVFASRHAEVLRNRPRNGSVPDVLMRSRSLVRKPRVLLCDELLPHLKTGAGYPRANRMIHTLLDLGCEVCCLPAVHVDPSENWVTIAVDIPLAAEILAFQPYGPDRVSKVLAERQGYYDYLVVSRPTTMKNLRPLLSRHPEWFTGMKLIYDAEAIFALREVREERLQGKAISEREIDERVRRELSLCAGFERILTVSKEEALQFAEHGLDAYIVGHAATIAPCEAAWNTRQDILFVGAIHGDDVPNALAVFWFLEQVWPALHRRLPWARFVIVGLNRSPRLNSQPLPERIVVTGAVDDLTPFYESARVFVAPTRAAAGIPLKVVEAAGRGVPVVATPLLVSQLRWNSPAEILAADGGSQFADACVKLCTDERIWQLQREAALARVTAEYSPAVFAQQLRRALGLQSS